MRKTIFALFLALLLAWMITAAAGIDLSTDDVVTQVPDIAADFQPDGTAQTDLVDVDLPFDEEKGVMWGIDQSHHKQGRHSHHRRRHRNHKHSEMHPMKHCHTTRCNYARTVALFKKAQVKYQGATLKLSRGLADLQAINDTNATALAEAIAEIVTAQKKFTNSNAKLNDAIVKLSSLNDVCKQSNAALEAENRRLQDALAICHADDQSCRTSLLKCEANKTDTNKRCLLELAATQTTCSFFLTIFWS
jgi:cell division protein FtsB